MSALRLSRPGYPTELIDQGPAVGFYARGTFQGALVTGMTGKQVSKLAEKRRPMHLRPIVERPAKPLCGRVFPRNGRTCAREAGHGFECKSRHAMDVIAERRRAVFL